jgi:hypothetical protein
MMVGVWPISLARPPAVPSLHLHRLNLCHTPFTMKNDEGEVVDLYIPRKWCVLVWALLQGGLRC